MEATNARVHSKSQVPSVLPGTSPGDSHSIFACLSTTELWHFRLGHVSFNYLQSLNIPNYNKLHKHSVYQICPKAKMHRLPFPISHSRANKVFELLHVDILGPYPHSMYNGYKFFLTI